MIIKAKAHAGRNNGPAIFIELIIKSKKYTIKEDITDVFGMIDPLLISSLRDIADGLEDQNRRVKSKKKELA